MWFRFAIVAYFSLCVFVTEPKCSKCDMSVSDNTTKTSNGLFDWGALLGGGGDNKTTNDTEPIAWSWSSWLADRNSSNKGNSSNYGDDESARNVTQSNVTMNGIPPNTTNVQNSSGFQNTTEFQNISGSENATAPPNTTEFHNFTDSENEAEEENKFGTAYWIPIFNFGNDFYFGTNKGYAKLVNFPPPVIYSFLPVGAQMKMNSRSGGQKRSGEQRRDDEFSDQSGNYFENEFNFADCYTNSEMGNMIPYSYFGNWVSVANVKRGWYLQTYDGFVRLDMNASEAPLMYEFNPIVYQYSDGNVQNVVLVDQQMGADAQETDAGLAQLNEPVVLED